MIVSLGTFVWEIAVNMDVGTMKIADLKNFVETMCVKIRVLTI